MNVTDLLWSIARSDKKRALPILSFPAVQKMGVTVEEMVKSSELQARAMEIIAEATDTVAAVSPMDLSVEAEAFGASVCFAADEVPAITGRLVSDADGANRLAVPELCSGRAGVSIEGVRLAKQRISGKPVLAGMIGPYSLAGRLMDVTEIMYACYDEPETVHTVLNKATEYLIKYAAAMKQAGADGIMMAEPLAGILSPDMAEEFSVPYVSQIIQAVQSEEFPIIYHNCGNAVPRMLDKLFSQGAAAYHFGNAVDMSDVLSHAPENVICLGNVDPAGVLANGTPETVRRDTLELLKRCRQYKNFVPSSGCDIPAHTSWDNIGAFFGAVNEYEA